MKFLTLFLLASVVFLSCSDTDSNRRQAPSEGQKITLLESTTTLKLPVTFNRLDAASYIEADSTYHSANWISPLLQITLRNLTFEDAQIDLFVDSTERLSLLAIVDTQYLPLSKQAGSLMASSIKNSQYEDSLHTYKTIDKSLRNNSRMGIMKFRYAVESVSQAYSKFHQTLWFVTTKKKTYVIFEITPNETDTDDYLWTIVD